MDFRATRWLPLPLMTHGRDIETMLFFIVSDCIPLHLSGNYVRPGPLSALKFF